MTTAKTETTSAFSDQVRDALKQPLADPLVKSRKGDRGRDVSYIEGHTAIAQLNRIFGPDNWGYTVDEHGVDEYAEGPVQEWYALYWAQVTLHVKGSLPRTDLGRIEVRNTLKDGKLTNSVRNVDQRSLGLVGCVTDALKRAARTYGEQFGNGLYDKDGDVYPWMEANRVESDEEYAVRIKQLRADVLAALQRDTEAATLMTNKSGKTLEDTVQAMAEADMATALAKLVARAKRATS